MMRKPFKALTWICVALLAAACSPSPTPSPSGSLEFPPDVTFENRGGPALVVTVNGVDVATIECNDTGRLTPGDAGLPQLPWTVSVARRRDGAPVYSGEITTAPQWFLQIGDSSLGIGSTPPAGPPGPSCPPEEET